nr:hypothetical protein RP007_05827 [Rhizobium sp. P007]
MDVLTGARAIQELIFFGKAQTVTSAAVDVGAKRGRVVQDLARGLEQVRDRANRRGRHIERQIRIRLCSRFGDRRSIVRVARFLDVLDRARSSLTRQNKVADGQLTLRQTEDAGNASARNQRRALRAAGADSGIGRGDCSTISLHADRAARCTGEHTGLELGRIDDEVTERLLLVFADFVFSSGTLLKVTEAGRNVPEFGKCLVGLFLQLSGNVCACTNLFGKVRTEILHLLLDGRKRSTELADLIGKLIISHVWLLYRMSGDFASAISRSMAAKAAASVSTSGAP